jgi:UDP-N-acetyl-D-mannosaminuronic acid dehydrogenase
VVAAAGHPVHGLDVNAGRCADLSAGRVPYLEHGAPALLRACLDDGRIHFGIDTAPLARCDVVVIMLGTPVDEESNPRFDDLFAFVDSTLAPALAPGQLVVLRCTVSPGTTELLRARLEATTGKKEGVDFHLVFCPERVAQSHGINESTAFPQLVGAFGRASFEVAAAFFESFVLKECVELTPREAELGKLVRLRRVVCLCVYVVCVWVVWVGGGCLGGSCCQVRPAGAARWPTY